MSGAYGLERERERETLRNKNNDGNDNKMFGRGVFYVSGKEKLGCKYNFRNEGDSDKRDRIGDRTNNNLYQKLCDSAKSNSK